MSDRCSHTTVAAELGRLSSALERLTSELTPHALAQAMARELLGLVGGRSCVVSRREGETLAPFAACASADRWRSPFESYAYLLDDYPLTRQILETGVPTALSLDDPDPDPAEAFVLREVGMTTVLMVPLNAGGLSWGLAEVYDGDGRRFGEEDVLRASFLARQAAGLLAQLDHTESVERLHRETLASLANALEEKDAYTHDHTQEVVALSLDVGRALGLEPGELELVELGALFHDIGKIRVPESILNKPGPLDEEEWGVMRRHTIVGESILAPITSLRAVLPIIRSSHERWDGTGYPDGLAAEAIPAGARIVAVCDAFRAMTETRPYRQSLSEPEACLELRQNAGTQFDPACVDALLGVLKGRRRGDERIPLHRPARAA